MKRKSRHESGRYIKVTRSNESQNEQRSTSFSLVARFSFGVGRATPESKGQLSLLSICDAHLTLPLFARWLGS